MDTDAETWTLQDESAATNARSIAMHLPIVLHRLVFFLLPWILTATGLLHVAGPETTLHQDMTIPHWEKTESETVCITQTMITLLLAEE